MNFNFINQLQIRDTIDWHYFRQSPKTTSHLFASLIKINSELSYELPLLKTIEILTHLSDKKESQVVSSDHNLSIHNTMYHSEIGTMGKLLNVDENEEIQLASKNLFVYVFHHTNTIDMRGNVNYFGGNF